MNKQYMEVDTKLKKAYLIMVAKVAIWLYHSLAGVRENIYCSKTRGENKLRMGFWNQHVTLYKNSIGHASYQREIIIYCIPIG